MQRKRSTSEQIENLSLGPLDVLSFNTCILACTLRERTISHSVLKSFMSCLQNFFMSVSNS